MLRSVVTDVSGKPIDPIFKGQAVKEEFIAAIDKGGRSQ
jgi:hypothetical protein